MIYAFPYFEQLMAFIIERYRIYERRRDGKPAPWTKDKILRQYRFCNVYRELDRVTIWIAEHWRKPHDGYKDLWFAMAVARLINHPDTLIQLALPGRWNKKHFLTVMHDRRDLGEKTFGSAYIVSTNGQSMDKAEYLATYVLDPMWHDRAQYQPHARDSLGEYYKKLLRAPGMGSFMTAQVIADLKYVAPLCDATDWWTFAASGPGSRRGMSYVMGYDPRMKWKESEWITAIGVLAQLVRPQLREHNLPRMHNQDLQNCLCEFSKYRRTQLGTGRPKQRFTPHHEMIL